MHITSLEIILAVVAVFVIFGPKELPRRNKKPAPIKITQRERAPYVPKAPSQYAAGRAPSPLQLRAAERPLRVARGESVKDERPQFAAGDSDASPLPHELLRV
ncbi:MAG: hypothetical protein JHC98_02355 [Thermoleophilaceae bacterium]|nr:hypothetical protein [Thermoleophilaceae bacterium]